MYQCVLCQRETGDLFFSDKNRDFYKCPRCNLVFVPGNYYLSEKREKERYDLHENSPGNRGYMEYLSRIADAIQDHVKTPVQGLDFGSGPKPVFADLLRERGFDMRIYDPFYAPDQLVFRRKYNLITLVEVIEHLKDPLTELQRLRTCLMPDGLMAVRTEMIPERVEAFRSWSYKNDLTHICFYSSKTFGWLGSEMGFRLLIPMPQLVLMYGI